MKTDVPTVLVSHNMSQHMAQQEFSSAMHVFDACCIFDAQRCWVLNVVGWNELGFH